MRRLLVIDADRALSDAYAAHFTRCGYDVRCAATLAEAAALLEASPVDAVIADVRDPDPDAPGAPPIARWLDASAAPPVVVLTAYGEPAWGPKAASLGVDAFLHKPVSLVWLEQLLRTRIEDRLHAAAVEATG